MNTSDEMAINTEQLFDMSYVNKICRNNTEAVKKMITVFINTIPAAVQEIKRAYKREDYDAIKKTAHRIKPVILIYAIVKAQKTILEIEHISKNHTNVAGLTEKINALEHTINLVINKMKNEFELL